MHTIYDLTTFDLEKEHDLEYNSELETQFSEPKIYNPKGDPSNS